MRHASLRDAVHDLEHEGQLVRVEDEVDPRLEMASVQRRLYAAGGPAVLFERVKGCAFPAVCNLYGTLDRCRFLFRDTIARVRAAIALRADPAAALRRPWRFATVPLAALRALPRRVRSGPVLAHETTISALPQITSWPDDGGPFVTLPQVYTEMPGRTGPMASNLGMYRIQLAGNRYLRDREVGLHYQIHRGIGVHHSAAAERGEPLRVSVFVGGPPAHAFAAVMPLPEGLSELTFAGMLAGRRFRWTRRDGHVISTDADFVIVGRVDPKRTLPEGPFGDHLGYYSLVHDFPVLEVEHVWHRDGAIWPFTVVGRPPQEDTTFGAMIHELTREMVPASIPGVHALHAVDAAGVHPLMLAIGSERYVPWQPRAPREVLTQACAILGFGQASLAKWLFIAAKEDAPELETHDVGAFLQHVLARVDLERDLHFHTRTTIDTLDYSGTALNEGSKLVVAGVGEPRRELGRELPRDLTLPEGWGPVASILPGVLAMGAPPHEAAPLRTLVDHLGAREDLSTPRTPWPMIVVVDDLAFVAESLRNFLWVAFTRTNPSHDVDGIDAGILHKHWGCRGALVVDARSKAHHAPPLVEDAAVERRVDRLFARSGPLHGYG